MALLSGMGQHASAGFLSNYSGNSQFQFDGAATSDGIVNFAVYHNPGGGDWTDDFGLPAGTIQQLFEPSGSGQSVGNGLDTTAEYVYFYQIVNTDPNTSDESELKSLELFLPGTTSMITSAGYLDDYVFDDGGPTGPTGNARLGTFTDTTAADDVPGDATPSESGAVPSGSGFVAHGSAVEPDNADEIGSSTIEFNFTAQVPIPPGGFSSVFFLTSFGAPIYHPELLEDGDNTHADIPIPNPEPSSVAMTLGV
ncbi:MAG TPA: hypothetical protein VF175_02780, partial [Lacipirellula sp.]